MQRKLIPAVTALFAAAALVPATGAVAQDAGTTTPGVEITGAYAYVDNALGDGKTYASVVFRTADPLPRRHDGMIRASGSLDGTAHSLGSVRGKDGKASNLYTFLVQIRNGKVAGPKGKSAKLGSKHTVVVFARGTNGDISGTATVTLRKKRAGDRSGKPLR
jgi:hypothetical protein